MGPYKYMKIFLSTMTFGLFFSTFYSSTVLADFKCNSCSPEDCNKCIEMAKEKANAHQRIENLKKLEVKNSELLKMETRTSATIKLNSNLFLIKVNRETENAKLNKIEEESKMCGVCNGTKENG